VKPVISGAQQKKKKIPGEGFLAASGRTVWDSVLEQVLIPNIKRGLTEIATAALNTFLYGVNPTSHRAGFQFTPRSNYMTRPTQPINQYHAARQSSTAQSAPPDGVDADLGEIHVQTREDAYALRNSINTYIREYGQISVSTIAEMAGLRVPYTGNEWGYYTLQGATIRDTGSSICILLPPPTYLKG